MSSALFPPAFPPLSHVPYSLARRWGKTVVPSFDFSRNLPAPAKPRTPAPDFFAKQHQRFFFVKETHVFGERGFFFFV